MPPVGCGTSNPGLGFPGLTAKAEQIKAETPCPSDLSQPGNHGLTELPGLAMRSGGWEASTGMSPAPSEREESLE